MTIHVVCKWPVNLDEAAYSVSTDAEGVTVTRLEDLTSVVVKVTDLVNFPGGAVINRLGAGGYALIAADDLINQKDVYAYLATAQGITETIGALIPDIGGSNAAAVFKVPVKCDQEVVIVEKNGTFSQAVDSVFPGTSERREKFRSAKINLLSKLGAHDSLSSLEKQVDLLTSLVLALCESSPSLQTELVDVLSRIHTEAASTKDMNPAVAAEKILTFKRKLREYQAQYFSALEN